MAYPTHPREESIARLQAGSMNDASDGTHASTPPNSRGIGVWTPLCIVGGTLLAGIVALLHYIFDSHLNKHSVFGYWTQTKSSQIEILLANAFKILFCFSAGVSLCQVSWHTMRRQPLRLPDLNALLSEPSLKTLPRINLIFQAPLALAIIVTILASPLITVFAPSLTARQADGVTRTLTVPTLNLTTDGVLGDFTEKNSQYGLVTSTWDKAALGALLSADVVGWPIPDGCAPECQYNLTYSAPAVRCSDLTPDQIDDGVSDSTRYVSRVFQDPPAAYLLAYDSELSSSASAALNFTAQDRFAGLSEDSSVLNDQYGWTLAYVPFSASNADPGALINAAGSVCTFFNATHEARTHYFNGTQETHVSVVEFHAPLNTTYKVRFGLYTDGGDLTGTIVGVEGVSYAPGVGAQVHALAMADAINNRLIGTIIRNGNTGILSTADTLIAETNIFDPIDSLAPGTQFPGLNISSPIANVSQALQDLVANATVGFIHLNTGFVTVLASVPSSDIVYIFKNRTLAITYLLSLSILVLIGVAGMFALISNGEPSSNGFSELLLATRNPKLDAVAKTVKADPQLSDRLRLMFGSVTMPNGEVDTVFGVASEQKVEALRKCM
ncbi:hypothetical protein MVEN_02347200 [Mycena venus]|uniref:Uncharacterized protein n=1 Tax=Mycena venus TaxID=2733690 RepID=A0A8H6X352_9AGAR|nr:hypothetical protein MVEN_02347200 [Mycena venus]